MEDFDISRVVKAYGAAPKRCREGDLDGVEIEAYGHLFDAFLSPRTNSREDNYGGSLENRMRFGIEVLERNAPPGWADFIIGVRMAVDEAASDGFGFNEGVEIAQRLHEAKPDRFPQCHRRHDRYRRVAFAYHSPDGDPGRTQLRQGEGGAQPALPGLPIFHAARINDLATARHWVSDDAVDMIGMTRAHMADPHIVAKMMRGEEDRIRPCVGAGYCIDRIYQGGEALCLHNPATGREETMPHVIAPSTGPKKNDRHRRRGPRRS